VYEASISRGRSGEVTPRNECLRYAQPKSGHAQPFKMLEAQSGRTRIFDPTTGRLTPFNVPGAAAGESNLPLSTGQQATPQDVRPTLSLAHMRFEHQFPIPTWVRAYLTSFCFYRGFEVGRGSPVRTKAAEIRPHAVLNESGDNLGTVLHEILGRSEFRDVSQDLREWLGAGYDHFKDISAETAYGGEPRVLVRLAETKLKRTTEIWELSDGTLRFLLLCAALLNPTGPGLIAIDEPETGLHPKLLPIVADLIRAASERAQVLVTTHSPQLLNCFDLSEIAVMTREGGQAAWHRPSSKETLRQMLESQLGGTLGDLHASGELEALR
jgi:predicted ATPase